MSKVIGVVDEYKCNVSPEIAKIGAEELREDANIRLQSLQSFREWILKNEHILKCRLDSGFLLRFLRVKKYSLPMAQEVFMKHLAARAIMPEYFHNLDVLAPHVDKVFSQGGLIMLKGKDDDGRRVMVFDYDKIPPTKEDLTAAFKSFSVACEVLLNNEDNQIAGITTLISCKGISLSHIPLLSPTLLQRVSTAFFKSYGMRFHQIHLAFMPSFVMRTLEIVKYFVGPKIASRIVVHSADKQLRDVIPKRLLPVEFGGETSTTKELISLWKEEMLVNRESLLSLDEIAIDEKYKMKRMNEISPSFGIEGSFRQLEID